MCLVLLELSAVGGEMLGLVSRRCDVRPQDSGQQAAVQRRPREGADAVFLRGREDFAGLAVPRVRRVALSRHGIAGQTPDI